MDQPSALSRDLIGRESEVVLVEVERGAIRKFAEAVQDQTPECLGGDVAPPTFPTTFRIPISGLIYDLARVLHGAQEYRYERPLRPRGRLEGGIAHGMLSRAFLGEYLCWLAGPESIRRLSVRFNEMVRPGDSLTCRGRVKDQTTGNGRRQLLLEVWAENQRAERVTVGEAEVQIT